LKQDFFCHFWGVRGTRACPGPDTLRFGGNTSCVEVRCGEHRLIFDAGTGICPLGEQLAAVGPVSADIFLSHMHYDHIIGLPLFQPAYDPDNHFRIWAARQEDDIKTVLARFMGAPYFPVPFDTLSSNLSFVDFTAGETLTPSPGIHVTTAPLNHTNGATGYRVQFNGKSICYVTDNEHGEASHERQLLELIRDADLLIYDSTYTEEEYPSYKGWGHSTWQEGVRLCEAANVAVFVAYHHAPQHDDDFMTALALQLEARRPGSVVAREGMRLHP